MGEFSTQLAQLFTRAAAEQGGVISGDNPTTYNPLNPFRLWVIQVVIIIFMTQFLSLFLSRIRQPRVIAEVIGGILLGPTVMGRIPGFQRRIFPDAGMPGLNLTSTIGLIIFLFLVGLEIDVRIVKRNMRASALISLAGLVIPLGLGAALGVGIYREFINPSVNFGYFLLFTAVAVGITAFPVLCRILTELKLLETTVGVVVLSAGVGNDVIGWILLALAVALVNASSGLTALWVLLVSAGFVVVLLYPGRWAFVWLARRTGSLEQGSPTHFMMTVTLVVVFACAFFTDIIGVHAIFGGFLAGLIIPHENGFAISLVEKLEDLVSILFLPIYFTLSGLKTNLGLLYNGVTWGYTIIICLVAFASKFCSCGIVAYWAGFNWRESGAIGSLMSCKGLVELIVLNIGLQAGILDTRTFSMFVVHALILTVITTPLTLFFYPPKYRTRDIADTEKNEYDTEGGMPPRKSLGEDDMRTKFAMVFDKMEQLPAAMTLAQLLHVDIPALISRTSVSDDDKKSLNVDDPATDAIALERSPTINDPVASRVTIDALRLIELTTRTSAVLKSQEADSLVYNDPVISVFRTFGQLNRLPVTSTLSVVSWEEFPYAIANHAKRYESEMVIIPWSRGTTSVNEDDTQGVRNPFDGIFHKAATTTQDQTSSFVYSEFIRNVFLNTPTDVALFVDRGMGTAALGPAAGVGGQHLFLPFFGGPDDRLALKFVVQLCANQNVHATVGWIKPSEDLTPLNSIDEAKATASAEASAYMQNQSTVAAADTIYPTFNPQTRLASETADNILFDKYARTTSPHATALSRMTFTTTNSNRPLHTVHELASTTAKAHAGSTLVVVLGRSRRMAVTSHEAELRTLILEKGATVGKLVSRTLGDVGAALVATNVEASLLVVQAASVSSS